MNALIKIFMLTF